MSIPVFPTVGAPDYPLAEKPEDAVIRSNFEDGTEKTRPRFTRNRMTYEVSWNNMPETQKQEIETFYRTTTKNGALAFNWTHPSNGNVLTVRFTEPPSFNLKMLHWWSVSIKLREV